MFSHNFETKLAESQLLANAISQSIKLWKESYIIKLMTYAMSQKNYHFRKISIFVVTEDKFEKTKTRHAAWRKLYLVTSYTETYVPNVSQSSICHVLRRAIREYISDLYDRIAHVRHRALCIEPPIDSGNPCLSKTLTFQRGTKTSVKHCNLNEALQPQRATATSVKLAKLRLYIQIPTIKGIRWGFPTWLCIGVRR